MISFRYISDKIIYIEIDGNKIATISDSCCSTTIRFTSDKKYVELFFQAGAGGFLAKRKTIDGDIVYTYREKIFEVFNYVYKSESLRKYLQRDHLKLNRQHIEDGNHIEILKMYEK
jgi:hypothetical protein